MAIHSRLGGAPDLKGDSALRMEFVNGTQYHCAARHRTDNARLAAAALVIIDEAARVEDDLLAAVRPMLATSGGRLIALTTPAGKRGWFFEAWHGTEIGSASMYPSIMPAYQHGVSCRD